MGTKPVTQTPERFEGRLSDNIDFNQNRIKARRTGPNLHTSHCNEGDSAFGQILPKDSVAVITTRCRFIAQLGRGNVAFWGFGAPPLVAGDEARSKTRVMDRLSRSLRPQRTTFRTTTIYTQREHIPPTT